jgi:hypothetical protein
MPWLGGLPPGNPERAIASLRLDLCSAALAHRALAKLKHGNGSAIASAIIGAGTCWEGTTITDLGAVARTWVMIAVAARPG